MTPRPIFFSSVPKEASSFFPQNEHREYKHTLTHEVSAAKSVGLKGLGLWGACAFGPVSCSTAFLTREAGFTGQQTPAHAG